MASRDLEVLLGCKYPETIQLRENFLCRQYVKVPLRVNVNLKAVTVEDLIARRKVRRLYCCIRPFWCDNTLLMIQSQK
jgi:hypothetical protein